MLGATAEPVVQQWSLEVGPEACILVVFTKLSESDSPADNLGGEAPI